MDIGPAEAVGNVVEFLKVLKEHKPDTVKWALTIMDLSDDAFEESISTVTQIYEEL